MKICKKFDEKVTLNYMNNEKEYKYGYVWDNDYGNIVVEFFNHKKAKDWYNYEMSIYHEPYLYTTDEELINLIGKDNYKYIIDDDYVDKWGFWDEFDCTVYYIDYFE